MVEIADDGDPNFEDAMNFDADNDNPQHFLGQDHHEQSPPNSPQQGTEVVASMDFLHILNRPLLHRRMQGVLETPAGNTIVPSIESTPIEVRSGSTGKKCKNFGTASLAKATASGTKALVAAIDKIRDSTEAVEDKRLKDVAMVSEKQLECFRYRD